MPSQARSLRTRALIVESARELANTKGVGAVTMQMVAAKAKIAAGTAYQFFDDRDSIFFDMYESWATEWWANLISGTTQAWTHDTWMVALDRVIESGCRFHLKHSDMWEVLRYVESTKVGRDGMKLLFEANVDRTIQWAGPYLKSLGKSPSDIRQLCTSLVRTSRGHHMYWPMSPMSLKETIRLSQEAQRAIVETSLRSDKRLKAGDRVRATSA